MTGTRKDSRFGAWLRTYDTDTIRELDVDLSQLPATLILRQSVFVAVLMLLVGGVFVGTPLIIAAKAPALNREDAFYLFLLLPVGLWFLIRGLRNIRRVRTATLEQDRIVAVDRWLLGTHRWSEPLSRYEALVLSKTVVSHNRPRRRAALVDYHAIELRHADRSRCVRLAQLPDETQAQNRWRALAAQLGLEAVHEQ